MTRNLDRRIEVNTPIYDLQLKRRFPRCSTCS